MVQIDPPLIIDVEASGFGYASYPIEIGLALANAQRYCALIQPAPDWTHWDESAEKIHRIPRDILQTYGKSIAEVADHLNLLLADRTVYSDGWVVDKPWISALFYAARKPLKFHVSPLEAILSEHQMTRWHATKDLVVAELELARHRASNDAWIIQETYTRTRAKD